MNKSDKCLLVFGGLILLPVALLLGALGVLIYPLKLAAEFLVVTLNGAKMKHTGNNRFIR